MRSSFLKLGSVCLLMVLCSTVRADMVENPLYKAWSKYAVGSSSTLSIKQSAAGHDTTAQTKSTLSSVADDEVVLDLNTSVVVNGQTVSPPAQKIHIKKMVDPAAAATPGSPKPIDPKIFENAPEETVTVAAGTFKAKVVEMNNVHGTITMKTKMWFTDEVPGGLVKLEMTGDGAAAMTMTGELTAVEKK